MLLPNLRHLEHGISTYHRQEIVSIKDKILTVNGKMISWQHEFPVENMKQALALGLRIILVNVTTNVISLKSRDAPVWLGLQMFMIPSSLQHLDLEMRLGNLGNFKSRKFILKTGSHVPEKSWRRHLQVMKQLKTLRLGLLPDAKHYAAHDEGYSDFYYVDDLLVNPKHPTDHCFFSQLERLELSDCACRLNGLLAFVEKHQQILKQLILNRVILPPDYTSPAWNEVAAMCKEAVPGLAYLRLTKLVPRHPTRLNNNRNNGVGVKPTPKEWALGLENARTYEWTKGGANGTDEEFIGYKCPWTCEDAFEGNGKVCL